MRVAEHDLRAHAAEFIGEIHAPFVHPVVEEHGALRLSCYHDGNAHQVGGESGPRHHVDLRDRLADIGFDAQLLLGGDEDVLALHFPLHTQTAEDQPHHIQIARPGIADTDLPAGDHRRADEADHFQVVGADGELAAAQPRHALDVQCVRADVADFAPQGVDQVTQFLDMRLGSGVAQDGLAFGGGCGHDGVFGGGHAGFIEQDVGTVEFFGGEVEQALGAAVVHVGAHRFQRQDVRIHAAASDHIATRRRQVQFAAARQHRPGQQNRGADVAADRRVQPVRAHLTGVHPPAVIPHRLYRNTHAGQQLAHGEYIADLRHVVQHHWLVGQ